MDELWQLTIHEAQQRLARRETNAFELACSSLQRIHQVEDRVKSFITITEDLAMQQSWEADRRIVSGKAETLTGIPVQVKDLICTRGIRTT